MLNMCSFVILAISVAISLSSFCSWYTYYHSSFTSSSYSLFRPRIRLRWTSIDTFFDWLYKVSSCWLIISKRKTSNFSLATSGSGIVWLLMMTSLLVIYILCLCRLISSDVAFSSPRMRPSRMMTSDVVSSDFWINSSGFIYMNCLVCYHLTENTAELAMYNQLNLLKSIIS